MAQSTVRSPPGAGDALPPFPNRQMLVLAFCRLCEPIAFTSIFPYIYFMIQDLDPSMAPDKISLYVGLMTTVFAFAEFSTGALWGKISDYIGRKPVLLFGLFGTMLSVLTLGFAPNIATALVARALGGLLNGNIGVLQTIVGELVTVKEHQARAFAIMPLVWNIGSITGPIIGGALAKPCDNFPRFFHRGSVWDHYPYLLPNLCCAIVLCIGVIIGCFFLEETHPDKSPQQKTEHTQPSSSSACNTEYGNSNDPESSSKAIRLPQKTFSRQVLLNIASYSILAFHTMTFDQLLPVFLSMKPVEDRKISLPFQFVDGFGMNSQEIGVILSVQGGYSMFATGCLFPVAMHWIGALRLYKILAMTFLLQYIFAPYIVLLPGSLKMIGLYLLVIWRCTYSSIAYPANAILLVNAAPSYRVLGTINGVAASSASLCRAISPAISGYLYGLGLKVACSGLAWWFNALITIPGALIAMGLRDSHHHHDEPCPPEETSLLVPGSQPLSYGISEEEEGT